MATPAAGRAISSSIPISNPLHYPKARRWGMVIVLTLATIVTLIHTLEAARKEDSPDEKSRSLYATAFEPALPYVMQEFGSDSDSLATFTVSIYALGYVFGPVLVAPASEVYGRLPVLHIGIVLFIVCLIICGFANNLGLFIFFRAIMGFSGVALVLLAPAVVADVIPKDNRALALSITTLGPALGPTLGPVMGGYIVERLEWRWIFWIGAMSLALSWAPAIFILRETFPLLLAVRAKDTIHQEDVNLDPGADDRGNAASGTASPTPAIADTTEHKESRPPPLSLKKAWTRPVKMLLGSRILLITALYTSLLNSYLQIFYAIIGTTVQSEYGFSTGTSGLAYLGLTVGLLLAQLFIGKFADRHLCWMAKRHGNIKKPEFRLLILIVGFIVYPIGLLLYGWSLQTHTHWIVPVIGTAFVGIGFLFGYLPCQFYVVDVYTLYAASALGGSTLLRSVITALLPLAADPIFHRMGYGWGFTLFTGLNLLFAPFMVLLYLRGESIRSKSSLEP